MLQRLKRGEIWPLPGGGTAEEVVAVAQARQQVAVRQAFDGLVGLDPRRGDEGPHGTYQDW